MGKDEWLTSDQVMSRLGINKLTLAAYIIRGQLKAYPVSRDWFVAGPDDGVIGSVKKHWMPVRSADEVRKLPIGIIAQNTNDLAFSIKENEGFLRGSQQAGSPLKDSHPKGGKLSPEEEKQADEFIRKLRVSLENDASINFKPFNRQEKTFTHSSMGFQYSTSKEWKVLCEIIREQKFSCGNAAYMGKRSNEKVRDKFYDQSQKLLRNINNKLLTFLTETYKIKFPEKYRIFDQRPEDPPRMYRPKFKTNEYLSEDLQTED